VRVRQVLINFVGNAIKFTQRGSVAVRVTLAQAGTGGAPDVLRFSVTDTGVGIDAEARRRLFRSFEQADASTTRRFGGTGLGLAICKQLASLMGGEVGVESEVGRGSTFWFTARMSRSPRPALASTPPAPTADAGPMPAGLRILVAEDNEINQLLITGLLRKRGYTATSVTDGRQAVDAVKAGQYDLVFMDCQMPEMDGYEAAAAIRAWERDQSDGRRARIVALTAGALTGDADACRAAGMDDYLTKPLVPARLDAVLRGTAGAVRTSA
jgi:CheY-like chemotaxis protein/anti-sigma regulatory factor (Ser/Thr protein kinase)